MGILQELFTSPELYPLEIDFEARVVRFVRMSQHAYRTCLFASFRAAKRLGGEFYDIRLHDVLLASRNALSHKRTLYILHTAYCCSTLLARYVELFPHSFVLREPPLLAQVANSQRLPSHQWNEALDLSVRLLTRTYNSEDTAVIKTHVPCNFIGRHFLEHNHLASVIYLFTPLRSFLLAVLKSEKRRQRIRIWNRGVSAAISRCEYLAEFPVEELNDAQSAAYWWLATRFLYGELCAGSDASRVRIVNGEELARSPEAILPLLMHCYGLTWDEKQSKKILTHPSARTHAKHPRQHFDGSALQKEAAGLEDRYGVEADVAMNWIASRGLDGDLFSGGRHQTAALTMPELSW